MHNGFATNQYPVAKNGANKLYQRMMAQEEDLEQKQNKNKKIKKKLINTA